MPQIPVDAFLKPAPERATEDIVKIRTYQAADQARVRWQAHIENVWYTAPMFADKSAVADAQIMGHLVPVLDKPLTMKPWIDSEAPLMLAKRGEEIEPIYRVLTPEAKGLLWDLMTALRTQDFSGKTLLASEKLVVTSLTRDSEKQAALNATEGVTANLRSTHGVGEAFDIWLDYFKNPPAGESAAARKRLAAHYDALMGVLHAWKKEGRINLIIEYDGRVAHVARNPYFVSGKSLGWEEVLKELRIDDLRGGKTIFGKPIVAWLDTYIPGAKWQLGSHLVKYFIQTPHENKDNSNRFDGWIRYHETNDHWEKMKEFILAEYARNIPHESREVQHRLKEMTVDTMILARKDYLSAHKRKYRSEMLSAAAEEDLRKAKRLKAYLYKAVNSEVWKKLGEYRLWDLPIWPVDAKGIRMDLMKWARSYPDAPPESWFDPAYLKSLAQITGSREPIEKPKPQEPPRQLSLFDDLSAGKSLGESASPAKSHGVVLDVTLDKSLRNLLKMQEDVAKKEYDIADPETLRSFMRSKAALRDDLGSASDSLPQVVPGDDIVDFLKEGTVLEQYWGILDRLYGGRPTAQMKFAPSREAVSAYIKDSLGLVQEILRLVKHARERAAEKGAPIPGDKSIVRDIAAQIHKADTVIEDIRVDLQKIEEFFIETTYDRQHPLRLDDVIEFEGEVGSNFDVLAEMLGAILPLSEQGTRQAVRAILTDYEKISDQLANSADRTKKKTITKKSLRAYVTGSRSLLRRANSLIKPYRVKGSSLGEDIMDKKILRDATGDLANKSMPIQGLEPAVAQLIQKIGDIYLEFYEKDSRAPHLSLRPTDEKVYKAKYTEKGTFEPSNIWDLAEVFLKAGLKPGDKVLDLGSGDGRVLAVASLLGAQVTGYEYDDALYGIAQDLLGRMGKEGLIDPSRSILKKGDFLSEPFGEHKFIFYFDHGSKDRAAIVRKILAEVGPGAQLLLYRAQGLRGTAFQDLGFVSHAYLVPLEAPFDQTQNRTLTIMRNPRAFLAPSSTVSGQSLGILRSFADAKEIAQAVNAMEGSVPVFLDMADYWKFSDSQRNEFLMLALQKKIKAVIYNDAESRVNADPDLASLKNVISYRGDATGAFTAYGQASTEKIIHLSIEADAREKLSRDRFYFFRQAGDEAGALLAALLYQLSDGKLQGVEEKDGFLTIDLDSALSKIVQEYEAEFDLATAA